MQRAEVQHACLLCRAAALPEVHGWIRKARAEKGLGAPELSFHFEEQELRGPLEKGGVDEAFALKQVAQVLQRVVGLSEGLFRSVLSFV
jgi:hypothetical protein